jgi:hypothetical protein
MPWEMDERAGAVAGLALLAKAARSLQAKEPKRWGQSEAS